MPSAPEARSETDCGGAHWSSASISIQVSCRWSSAQTVSFLQPGERSSYALLGAREPGRSERVRRSDRRSRARWSWRGVYAASEGLSVVSSTAASSAARPVPRPGSRTISIPTGISGMALMGRAYNQAQVRRPDGHPGGGRRARTLQDGMFQLTLSDGEHVRTRSLSDAGGALPQARDREL
jgi:hypothetical protein